MQAFMHIQNFDELSYMHTNKEKSILILPTLKGTERAYRWIMNLKIDKPVLSFQLMYRLIGINYNLLAYFCYLF